MRVGIADLFAVHGDAVVGVDLDNGGEIRHGKASLYLVRIIPYREGLLLALPATQLRASHTGQTLPNRRANQGRLARLLRKSHQGRYSRGYLRLPLQRNLGRRYRLPIQKYRLSIRYRYGRTFRPPWSWYLRKAFRIERT